jgi:hypothetical protein
MAEMPATIDAAAGCPVHQDRRGRGVAKWPQCRRLSTRRPGPPGSPRARRAEMAGMPATIDAAARSARIAAGAAAHGQPVGAGAVRA